MIRRRGFLGGLIVAVFSPAIPAKPADWSIPPVETQLVWKPKMVRVIPGLVPTPSGFAVQPMAKHIAALPIMGILKIDGLEMPPLARSSHPLPEIMDWDFEMISWRDENGALTNPPEGYRQ